MGADGMLMPLKLYAEDVLAMAKSFLDLAGLGQARTGPRRLDALAAGSGEAAQSLEDRNKHVVRASFFEGAFRDKRELHAASGTRYAINTNHFLRNVDYKLVTKLELGFGQFLDFGEEPGPNTQSFWVSAEGFFYVLSFRAADVSQRAFQTPIWILQAAWLY